MNQQATYIPAVTTAALVIFLLICWRDGALHMVNVWTVSPAYMHGFIVPLVSAGLIYDGWRREDHFATWPPALLGLAFAAIIYVTGSLTDIQFAQHIGVVGGVISLFVLMLGHSFAKRHRFALAFLFCAVPVGQELIPFLQEITAGGIVLVLNVLEVTSVRQGMLIRTEPGDFLVTEACAGLRFIVGMVVSGILFAHLLMRTWWKQVLFVTLCFLVPIIANLLRAIIVVMLGVWSDMSIATGFDHFVYGWGLFAVVFVVMLGLAFRMSEKGAPIRPTPTPAASHEARPLFWGGAALIILMGSLF